MNEIIENENENNNVENDDKQCQLCEIPLVEEDLTFTYPCSHRVHTHCLFITNVTHKVHIICTLCNRPIIDTEKANAAMEENRRKDIARHALDPEIYDKLEKISPEFKSNKKQLSKTVRKLNGTLRLFRQQTKQRIQKYKQDTQPLIDTLRYLKKQCQQELLKSPYIKEIRSLKRLLRKQLKPFFDIPRFDFHLFKMYLRRTHSIGKMNSHTANLFHNHATAQSIVQSMLRMRIYL